MSEPKRPREQVVEITWDVLKAISREQVPLGQLTDLASATRRVVAHAVHLLRVSPHVHFSDSGTPVGHHVEAAYTHSTCPKPPCREANVWAEFFRVAQGPAPERASGFGVSRRSGPK